MQSSSKLSPGSFAEDSPPSRTVVVLWMVGLIALGAALRFYRLGEQSVWLDDFLCMTNLDAASPAASLRFLKIYYPEQGQGPLNYFLSYYWAHLFGKSVVVLRTFTVLISLITIPMVYGLVRYMYRHSAGLVAALCFTLSPQHVWHAQEPRPYPLVMPLVIIAIYALLRALEERRLAWWGVNIVVNTLLVWTQILNALFILVQGVFMLVFFRRMFWRMTAWAIVQLIFLIPWTIWMLQMPYVNEIVGGGYPSEVLEEILFDDVIRYHTDLRPPFKTNPIEMVSPLARSLLTYQPYLNALLMGIVSLALAAFIVRPFVLWWWQRKGRITVETLRKEREYAVLLLIMLLLPGTVMGIIALVLHVPLLGSMYALYNTLAIYTMIGLLVTLVRPWPARGAAVLVLFVAYGYQLALILPETTRTNWLGVARHIEARATPDDRIYDIQFYGPGNYLPFNWPEIPLPIERVWTLESAVDRSTAFLASLDDAAKQAQVSAWLAYEDRLLQYRWPEGTANLEQAFLERNIAFETTPFPGHDNVVLIRAWSEPGSQPRVMDSPVPYMDTVDYDLALTELGLETTDPILRATRLEHLRHYLPFWPPLLRFFNYSQASSALGDGAIAVAGALYDWCADEDPSFGLCRFGQGMIEAIELDAHAPQSFQMAFERHLGLESTLGEYTEALLDMNSCDECLAEVDKLEATGYVSFARALRQACVERDRALRGVREVAP